jgi:hypothetical protein
MRTKSITKFKRAVPDISIQLAMPVCHKQLNLSHVIGMIIQNETGELQPHIRHKHSKENVEKLHGSFIWLIL